MSIRDCSTRSRGGQTDDLWVWGLEALAVYVRVAADRTSLPTAVICERLAQRRSVDLNTPN